MRTSGLYHRQICALNDTSARCDMLREVPSVVAHQVHHADCHNVWSDILASFCDFDPTCTRTALVYPRPGSRPSFALRLRAYLHRKAVMSAHMCQHVMQRPARAPVRYEPSTFALSGYTPHNPSSAAIPGMTLRRTLPDRFSVYACGYDHGTCAGNAW